MIELPWAKQSPGYREFKKQYGVVAAVTPFGKGERSLGSVWFVGKSSATVTGTLTPQWAQFGFTTLKDNDSSGYVDFSTPAFNQATFLAFWKPSTASVNRRVIDGDDISLDRQYQFRLNSSNQPEFIRFDTGGTPYFATCSAAANSTDCCVMIATSDGTSMRMYYARYPFADYLTASGTISNTPKTISNHRVFVSRGGLDISAGEHYLELIASRAWSDAEIQVVLRNPWQLFEPRRIYVRVPAAGGTFNAAFAESVGLTDSFSAGPAFSSTVAESIGASDAVSAQATLAAAVSESVAVTDQVSAQAIFAAALSESVTTADAITAAATYAASLLESLSLADQFEASRAFLAAIEETVALGDQIVGSFAQSAEIIESLSVSDAVAAQAVLTAAFQETLTAADQVSALAQLGAAITDAVQTGDQATAVVTALTSIAEAIAAADQFSATVTLAGSGPTAEQIAVAVWDSTLEGTLRARDLMKLHAAALFGKVIRSGNTIVFRNPQDTVNRITAVTDANGNRQSVTTDLN